MLENLKQVIPESTRNTALLRSFGFFKVPLIFLTSPKVVELNDEVCRVKIPLNKITKNHLNCMYFGTLCIGADAAGGLMAIKKTRESDFKASIIFKDLKANFLKRAEGDTVFTCEEGKAIDEMISEMRQTGERVNRPVKITATVPDKLGTEPVAEFILTLSLKPTS